MKEVKHEMTVKQLHGHGLDSRFHFMVVARSNFTWSKNRVFGTNVCLSAGFLFEFYVGCSTNPTATDKKHVCNLVSL